MRNMRNIKWYEGDKLTIYFSDTPHVSIRYVLPSMTDEEKKDIKKKPFLNKKDFEVYIYDHIKGQRHSFRIAKGYTFDGATIPKVFWRLIGPNTDNSFLVPALVHDVLCENHKYVKENRALSTNVFNALLEVAGVSKGKRFLMKNSVAFFQTFFCEWKR